MKNIFYILIAIFSLNMATYGQVGIGGTPKNGSVLDLTNSSNKYIILPVANTDPSIIMADSAALFYYKGNVYLKTSTGIKVFTPWEWDGTSTGTISSSAGSPVGIGVIPILNAPFRLQVADAIGDVTAVGSNASILVGTPASNHLIVDNNEIMAKTDPTTAGVLKFQEEGGTVDIRGASDAGTNTVLLAHGSIDAAGKLKENGNDLLPVGSIIMWSGATIPAGWALCNGLSYIGMDGNTVPTPDLRDRFIVGSGNSYANGNVGGVASVTLDTTQIPAHMHTVWDPNHSHVNSLTLHSGNSGGDPGEAQFGGKNDFPDRTATWTSATSNTGIKINSKGGSTSHENRPPYYALAYIMKL